MNNGNGKQPRILAQLHLMLIDNGTLRPAVNINGNLQDTMACLYMLEMARDIIKTFDPKKSIAIAPPGAIPPPLNGGN